MDCKNNKREKRFPRLSAHNDTLVYSLLILSVVLIFFVGCMPQVEAPTIPPVTDVTENVEEKEWKWKTTGDLPQILSFSVIEEGEKIQMFVNGKTDIALSDGDEYSVLAVRKKVSARKGDGEWRIYLDSAEVGVFTYE